jgi:hypothetical protein
MKTTMLLIVAMLAANAIMTAQADGGFMGYETDRARITEANGECEMHGALGADKQACFNAYLCVNYGECDGQNMQPIESLPGGGVYRDDVGGDDNG